jgi:CRISPR-associated protein Cas5d
MKPLRTQTKGTKPLMWNGGNSLAIYTFLHEVEYQIEAHFEWNEYRPELENDRIEKKHCSMLQRALKKGGRQDIFLGTRDCQGYVEPCEFGTGKGAYDDIDELGFGLMFHSFGYPDEIGGQQLRAQFWRATLKSGILKFPRPERCRVSRPIRPMGVKNFAMDSNITATEFEEIAEDES